MSKKIEIVGHIDHGKTTITSAISSVLASKGLHEQKTIDEIIEKENSMKIYAQPEYNLTDILVSSYREPNRRERRANERKKLN